MKDTQSNHRRNFLLAAGLGGAGAVAAVATGRKATQARDKQASAKEAAAEGYRVTDHVRKYYKTTEV
ncbi:MAG TPA: formate dehydrogenase [Usitatibacter sp.]|nr:formate dehydrogenase [Usitatibacter sp.]